MTKRVQKSLFVLVCLSASFLVALTCHGAEKEIAGPSIKVANVPHKCHTVKPLADRVRAHMNSEPLRFPNQHWVRGAYYAGADGHV